MSRKGKTIGEFELTHGQSKIKDLQHQLEVEHAKVEALAEVTSSVSIETSPDCEIRFGVIGDTHLGSLYFREEYLLAYYEYCASIGIDTVYHAGDLTDGIKVYKGQEFELRDVGLEAQVKRCEKVWKRLKATGVKTRFITGNHDQSFKAVAGAPIGKMIAEATGAEFLGEEQGRVEYQTPNGSFEIMLIHPGGGSSYATSYRLQKIIESLEGGTKPDLLAGGHFHKSIVMPSYRNVMGLLTGTFQAQTPFMARGGLAAHVGGWCVDVSVGRAHKRIRPEFIAFYGGE